TVFAVDQSPEPPERGPVTYVTVANKMLPGWAIALVGLSLILPALVASIDGFARARRRREPVGGFARWVLVACLGVVAGLVLAKLMVVVGIVADPPESPVAPQFRPLHGGDVVVLGVVAATIAVVWFLARGLAIGHGSRRLDLAAPGAGCALALVLSL